MKMTLRLWFVVILSPAMVWTSELDLDFSYDPQARAQALKEQLYISELCVRPPPGRDWPPWIELWNNGKEPVDLSGYSLSTLQTEIKPFPEGPVLKPDERCVLLFYSGKEPCQAFEERFLRGVRLVRYFGCDIFPPYYQQKDWMALMPAEALERLRDSCSGLPAAEAEKKINSSIVKHCGSTRYLNEVALRSPVGALVGYVAWGDASRDRNYKATAARQQAVDQGLIDGSKPSRIPRYFERMDMLCGVLQLFSHGVYRPLSVPSRNWSPGWPLSIRDAVPKPKARYPTGLSEIDKCFFLRFRMYNEEPYEERLERALGWLPIEYEVCLDREMTLPLFKDSAPKGKNPWGGFEVCLNPVDFTCLAGLPLYGRAIKRHRDKRALRSDVIEIRFGSLGALPVVSPYEKCVELDYKVLDINRDRVAWYMEKLNTAKQEVDARKGTMSCEVWGALDEVTIRFSGRELVTIPDLSGLPVRSLDLVGTGVTNLDPLRGLRLKELNLRGSPVKDLAALKGMWLELLDISGTEVTDLTPLLGCRLKQLVLDRSKYKNLDIFVGIRGEPSGEILGIDLIRSPSTPQPARSIEAPSQPDTDPEDDGRNAE